jgi:hypothetical protein
MMTFRASITILAVAIAPASIFALGAGVLWPAIIALVLSTGWLLYVTRVRV